MAQPAPTVSATKAAIRMAKRAFADALTATSCTAAERLFVRGRRWATIAQQGVRHHVARRGDVPLTAAQHDLLKLHGDLPAVEYDAHLHRLRACKLSEMEHERRFYAARAAEAGATVKAIDRRERRLARRR